MSSCSINRIEDIAKLYGVEKSSIAKTYAFPPFSQAARIKIEAEIRRSVKHFIEYGMWPFELRFNDNLNKSHLAP